MFNFFRKKKRILSITYYTDDSINVSINTSNNKYIAKLAIFLHKLTSGNLNYIILDNLKNKNNSTYNDILLSFAHIYLSEYNKPLIEPLNALHKNVK